MIIILRSLRIRPPYLAMIPCKACIVSSVPVESILSWSIVLRIRSTSVVGFSSSKSRRLPKPAMTWLRAPLAFWSSSRLSFNSLATRSNLSRMARWSSFIDSDSSKSQTTVSLCDWRWRRISRASWSRAWPTSETS